MATAKPLLSPETSKINEESLNPSPLSFGSLLEGVTGYWKLPSLVEELRKETMWRFRRPYGLGIGVKSEIADEATIY